MKRIQGDEANGRLTLAAILALALGMRLWGIGFGLPHRYHIDEPHTVLGALRSASGDFSPRLPPNSPNLWELILLLEYGLLFVVGRLTNVYASLGSFAASYRADPSPFYLLARGTSALFSTATVAVVFYAARDVYRDQRAGALAALFTATAFLLAREAHYGVSDTFVVFLTTAGVHLWTRYAQGSGAATLGWGSFLVGIAVGIKWRPIGLMPGLLAAVGLRGGGSAGGRWLGIKRFLLAGLALAAGFLIGFPALFISLDLFRWHLALILPWLPRLRTLPSPIARGRGSEAWMWFPASARVYYPRTLAWGLGLPLLSTAGGAMIEAAQRRDPGELTLMASASGFLAAICLPRVHYLRYALPLHPLLIVLAAGFTSSALRLVQGRLGQAGRWVSLVFIAGLVSLPTVRLIRHNQLLTRTDTRTLAKAWIESHVPDGASIAVEWPVHVPPLARPGDPEPNSKRVYDVTTVGSIGLQAHSLAWYRERGIEYLVATSFIYAIPMRDRTANKDREAFYASLEEDLELVEAIWPNRSQTEPSFVLDEVLGPVVSLWERDRPGPTLKIYRLRRHVGPEPAAPPRSPATPPQRRPAGRGAGAARPASPGTRRGDGRWRGPPAARRPPVRSARPCGGARACRAGGRPPPTSPRRR